MGAHQRTPNYRCVICEDEMYVRPSRLENMVHGSTCGKKECKHEFRSVFSSGEGNHQFGLKGELNSSFDGGRRISSYGYVLLLRPDHGRAMYGGYVFEHIVVMEEFLGRPLVFLGKQHSDNEVCHHKDENKQNNNIDNLELMTHGKHIRLHNLKSPRDIDSQGRFKKKEAAVGSTGTKKGQ